MMGILKIFTTTKTTVRQLVCNIKRMFPTFFNSRHSKVFYKNLEAPYRSLSCIYTIDYIKDIIFYLIYTYYYIKYTVYIYIFYEIIFLKIMKHIIYDRFILNNLTVPLI